MSGDCACVGTFFFENANYEGVERGVILAQLDVYGEVIDVLAVISEEEYRQRYELAQEIGGVAMFDSPEIFNGLPERDQRAYTSYLGASLLSPELVFASSPEKIIAFGDQRDIKATAA